MSERFNSWSQQENGSDAFEYIRNSLLSKLIAGTITLGGCENQIETPEKPKIIEIDATPDPIENFMPSYSKFHKNGEMTEEELRDKTIRLDEETTIIDDTGIYFYIVTEQDKTIEYIKEKLMRYPEFAHLKDQHGLQSLNIHSRHLKPGMKIPIPQVNAERIITDEQFRTDVQTALRQVLKNGEYGPTIKHIIDKPGMTENKLINALLAIAKQESGGEPIGQFEFHRFEGDNGHNEMSVGFGHVLMQGDGLQARKKLGMTEGQTFNITNAAKLVLAFLVEKSNRETKDLWDYFPFTEKNLEDFASFYNGGSWRKTNPDYAKNIWNYYKETQD